MSTLGDAFAGIEADNRERALADTFGHLAPVCGARYSCVYVRAVGERANGELNPTLLFSKGTLNASPWECDFFDDAIRVWGKRYGTGGKSYDRSFKPGVVICFEGTFRNYCAEGKLYQLADFAHPRAVQSEKLLDARAVYESDHKED